MIMVVQRVTVISIVLLLPKYGQLFEFLDSPTLNAAGKKSFQAIVPSLLYCLMLCRPGVNYIVAFLSRYMSGPRAQLLRVETGAESGCVEVSKLVLYKRAMR